MFEGSLTGFITGAEFFARDTLASTGLGDALFQFGDDLSTAGCKHSLDAGFYGGIGGEHHAESIDVGREGAPTSQNTEIWGTRFGGGSDQGYPAGFVMEKVLNVYAGTSASGSFDSGTHGKAVSTSAQDDRKYG
jgi:hypothetical protein